MRLPGWKGLVSAVFPPHLHEAEKILQKFLRKVGGTGAKIKSFFVFSEGRAFPAAFSVN